MVGRLVERTRGPLRWFFSPVPSLRSDGVPWRFPLALVSYVLVGLVGCSG